MRSPIACSAALLVLAATTPAFADPTAAERAVAETLFRDAKKLMARGKVPEACEKFASSYKIDAVGGTLINLAMCHEIEGKTAAAWTEFNEALSLAKKQGRADRQKAANEHIAALEKRLSRLTIAVPEAHAAPGLEVKIDGIVVAREALGTAIPVDPGDHVVSAAAPEKKPFSTKITMKEGQRQTLDVPALETAAPPPPPPPPEVRWKLPTGIAALGAGAVLLGVGTYFGARAVSQGGKVSEACPNRTCSPEGLEALDSGRKAASIANGTLIAGGAVAVAGTVLVILGTTSKPSDAPRAAQRFELTPVIGPGGAFLSAGGVF
ncbi:hypothetical protein A7982_12666 [Minicystis rosea]|nr:hypothetical protein A7982_12666 [Minicystis rosea]